MGPTHRGRAHEGHGTTTPRAPSRALAYVPVGLAAIALAGCSGGSSYAPAPIAEQPSCLADEVLGHWGEFHDLEADEPAPEATSGSVPDGFEPVDVVVCDLEERVNEEAELTGLVVHETWLTGDLTGLLAAFDRPSVVGGANNPDCELGWPGQVVWFVDADGRAVLAEEPKGRCGGGVVDVAELVAGLREVRHLKHPVHEVAY